MPADGATYTPKLHPRDERFRSMFAAIAKVDGPATGKPFQLPQSYDGLAGSIAAANAYRLRTEDR